MTSSSTSVRRRNPCFIELDDEWVPDAAALLRGHVHLESQSRLALRCAITGKRIPLDVADVAILTRLAGEQWQEIAAICPTTEDRERMEKLAQRFAVITDSADAEMRALAAAEEQMQAIGWHPVAALYHAASRWSNVEGDEATRDHSDGAHSARLAEHARLYGPVPPTYPSGSGEGPKIDLPMDRDESLLHSLLTSRRTTRHFDQDAALSISDLAHVLHWTFGTLGAQELSPGITALRRASPSGGALHPINAVVFVQKVAGLPAGSYRYCGRTHSLGLIRAMEASSIAAHVSRLLIGQDYFAEAHAVAFHVARVDRHHWKYRRHAKAYKALLLDSGHLSQTWYLTAAHLGLGAFYTAAINDVDIESELGLSGLRDMVIGASGLGLIDRARTDLHLQPIPWDYGTARLQTDPV